MYDIIFIEKEREENKFMNIHLTKEEAHLILMALEIAHMSYSDFEDIINENYALLDLNLLKLKLNTLTKELPI
jgi:hypothetical protein